MRQYYSVLYAFGLIGVTISQLPTCDPDNPAITNRPEKVGNDTVYYHCNYPNPQTQPAECGRTAASMICDPGRVLSVKQADELNQQLDTFYKDTPCTCGVCETKQRGSPLWIAVVKHLAITDLSAPQICVHGTCDDTYPKLPPGGRAPRDSEIRGSISGFGDQLLKQWRLESDCKNDVVIVYDATHKATYIAYRKQPQHRFLSSSNVQGIYSKADGYFSSGDATGGLKTMISSIKSKFKSGPSHQTIVIVTLSVIFGAVFLIAVIGGFIYCWRRGKEVGGGCWDGCVLFWRPKEGAFFVNPCNCCQVTEEVRQEQPKQEQPTA